MNKKQLTIDDFDTGLIRGECIAVDYSASIRAGHSLESYHPEVLCGQHNNFLASTYIDNEKIRLEVNFRWANETRAIINLLYFTLSGDKMVAIPNSTPDPIAGWYLSRWEMELVNLEGCDNENTKAIKDTLSWVRYDLDKIDELHKYINNKSKESVGKEYLLAGIEKTKTEITTTWHWRNNK